MVASVLQNSGGKGSNATPIEVRLPLRGAPWSRWPAGQGATVTRTALTASAVTGPRMTVMTLALALPAAGSESESGSRPRPTVTVAPGPGRPRAPSGAAGLTRRLALQPGSQCSEWHGQMPVVPTGTGTARRRSELVAAQRQSPRLIGIRVDGRMASARQGLRLGLGWVPLPLAVAQCQ